MTRRSNRIILNLKACCFLVSLGSLFLFIAHWPEKHEQGHWPKKLEVLNQLCPILGRQSDASPFLRQLVSAVDESSLVYSVDPALILAVIAAESRCNTDARSHRGAQGLMQLLPSTARWLGAGEVETVSENVLFGTKYLSIMLAEFNGDVEKALAAYNAGPAKVHKARGIPPYKETRAYVTRVLGFHQQLSDKVAKSAA